MAGNLKSLFGINQNVDDLFDDWMIKSMKSYRNLHMFELQHPTQVIEWINNDAICVAGCREGSRSEIIELVIPDKLIEDTQNEGCGKERDFKVRNGGFSHDAVYQLKHIPKSRVIVTSGPPDNSAITWQLGSENNDIIQETQTIKSNLTSLHHCYLDTHCDRSDGFVMGAVLGDIQCVDVETGKSTYSIGIDSIERLCGIKLLDANTCVACCSESGDIHVIDMRSGSINQSNQSSHKHSDQSESSKDIDNQSNPKIDSGVMNINQSKQESKFWSFDVQKTKTDTGCDTDMAKKRKFDAEDRTIFRLNLEQHILVNDIRNLRDPLVTCRLDLPDHVVKENISIQTSSCNAKYISISGINDKVYIYDVIDLKSTKAESVKPIFIHEGHMTTASANQDTVVWTHTWHPWKEHLLMSAASDGSLHAWDWVALQT
ncbi:integrator complex assembly factor WDR73-like [Glandiceps talaboti]